MVDDLIKRSKRKMTLKEAYELDKEINEFLMSKSNSKEDKSKLKNESYREMVAILADGYLYKNNLGRYRKK